VAGPARRAEGPLGRLAAGVRRRLGGWSPRGLLLYVLPLPLLPALLVSLFRADFGQIVGQLGALAGCWGAAVLARRGLRAEAVYHHRRIARRPLPRKTLAAGLLGASAALGAHVAVGHDWPFTALLGVGSVAGFVLAYGLDPLRAKRPAEGVADTEEVLRTLEEAEGRIARIEAASRRIASGELQQRLDHIAGLARSVVDLLEEDPGDLRRARRFLHVYLSGAQQVTERYATKNPLQPTPELDDRFRHVLGTIEQVFEEQRRRLLEDEVLDLDVQIEVLHRQLELEAARGAARRDA
jgi:hypothetical protein